MELETSSLAKEILTWGGVIGLIGGVLYKVFDFHLGIKNLLSRTKKLEDTVEMFHGKCDEVTTGMNDVVTWKQHNLTCQNNNARFCRKVDEIKARLDIRDSDDLKRRMIREARDINIASLLGRVEEHLRVNNESKTYSKDNRN